ncbi:MAG: hypothetical protein IKS15_04685 [Opitutales bacterium]|nr:hypothetical protein [Opitutales bacterium]
MKKIISTIISTLAIAVSAFAITDAEKTAFLNIVESNVVSGDGFMASVERTAKMTEAEPILAWADEYPEQFYSWVHSDVGYALKGRVEWVVRKGLNKSFSIYSVADAAICDYSATRDAAFNSSEVYDVCRGANFTFNGIKMSDGGIFFLTCRRYADPEAALANLPEKFLAERLDILLKAVRRAKLPAEKRFKILNELSTNYEQYKDEIKVVTDNWENLQNDKNEAFMALYAAKKLEALGL